MRIVIWQRVEAATEAKVTYFELAIRIDEQISGLEVSMNY